MVVKTGSIWSGWSNSLNPVDQLIHILWKSKHIWEYSNRSITNLLSMSSLEQNKKSWIRKLVKWMWVGSREPLSYKISPIFVHLWKHSLQLALFELEPCFFPLSKPQPIPSFHQLLMRRCLLLLFHWLLKKNKCEFVFCTQVLFDSIITIDSFDIVFREKRSILRHCIYIYVPNVKRNIFFH